MEIETASLSEFPDEGKDTGEQILGPEDRYIQMSRTLKNHSQGSDSSTCIF